MSDFISSAKNFVNSAVSRTSWEAQKQLRVRNKQSEIDKLLEQRQRLMDELGQVAMNLYQQGSLTDSQLSRLCASIFELDHDLRSRETQLQEAKNEAYPADQFAPGPTMNYAPPSPNTQTPPPNASYGQPQPGSSAGPSSNPGYSQPQPGPGAGSDRCPQCGNPLRPNALYCRSCGAKLR
ncbi:zinc-ribbon domain-containing protein [Dictyobacter aurantiacus]|uniref:Zinc ribbon domain-containing protein n=1 Tax=Dictyobacter aurantiacus TaxID=1936993 RepID=A0A401ZHX7_9CHLR|nr:zinc-ribbon domain-containing protein [Dictyobacter aurantiacus]GCE06443.1 zinc ribbon domain-containing protein [Dictyobacter aurantiacus]